MFEPLTLSQAIIRLNKKGYVEDFQVKNKMLCIRSKEKYFEPSTLIVDEVLRFEGETNLEDEAAVFALRDQNSGIKGTYVVAYGPDMDPLDMDIVQKLKIKKKLWLCFKKKRRDDNK